MLKTNYFFYLSLLFYLGAGLYLSIITGISHDEFHEQLNWEVNYKSIKEFLSTGSYNELLIYKDKYHGIGFNYISQPFQILISKFISTFLNISEYGGLLISKHIIVFSLFFISSLFFYSICRFLFNDKRFAIISLFIFLLYPYFFGHSQFNPKDIPFLSFWIICTYLIIKIIKELLNQKTIRYNLLFYLALTSSILVSIRIVGLLIFLQYLIFFIVFIENKKISYVSFANKQKKNIFFFLSVSLISIYIFIPILWHNPLEIFNSLSWMGKYFHDICTLTLGNCLKSLNLPASYYFIWLFFKLPILIILGFVLFPIIEKNLSKNLFNKIIIFSLLITISSILVIFILLNVAIYDELRHFMFLVPLILIIGLHNLYLLNKKFFSITGVLLIFFFIFENISLNPYQYTWMNSFAKFYNINKNFEVDYWGISGKRLSLTINEHSLINDVEKSSCVYGGQFANVFLKNYNFKCFKGYSALDSAKDRPFYVIKNVRNFKRSDPKNCQLIKLENYKYTFSNQIINVGSAWYCD